MKVAVLGPEGTYTHQAADSYFENAEYKFCSTIREVFDSDVETKFVPVENSLGGGVNDTLDLLKERDEIITAEIRLPIRHALISDSEMEKIEAVRSHPQALSQCRDFLDEKGWNQIEDSSTAAAVQNIGENEAAIGSEIAARLNGKSILETSIQDTDSNVTRFFVLNGSKSEGEKSALILTPGEDRPGLLHAMLSCFSGHQINLTHIQSRPTREGLGHYYFYVECEAAGEQLEKAVQCLETYASVRKLGSYLTTDMS